MSLRIRGQEVTLRVAVDGQIQEGSFFKATDFTLTERGDLMEEDFLGELESDLDYQHHGYDLSFTVQHQDRKVIDFLQTIVAREANAQAHPTITITVIYAYRTGDTPAIHVLQEVFLRPTEISFGGRKEYVSTPFEGKCKKALPMSA